MPFVKILEGENKGKYLTPSGRVWTLKQIRAYYATNKWSRPVKPKDKV